MDMCERCEAVFEVGFDKDSPVMVDTPRIQNDPSFPDALKTKGARKDIAPVPSNANFQSHISSTRHVEPQVIKPHSRVHGTFEMREAPWAVSKLWASFYDAAPNRSNKHEGPTKHHLEIQDTRFPAPSASSSRSKQMNHAQPFQPAMIVSQPSAIEFPPQASAHFNARGELIQIVPPVEGDDTDDDLDSLENLELLYPEPEEPSSELPPPNQNIPSSNNRTDPKTQRSDLRPANPPTRRPTRRLPSDVNISAVPREPQHPRPVVPPAPPPVKLVRQCTTPDCDEILHSDSTASRCVRCVKRDWTARIKALPALHRPLKRRKTVTWFDMVKKGSEDSVPQSHTPSSATKLTIRIPPLKSSRPNSPGSVATSSNVTPTLNTKWMPSTSSQPLLQQNDTLPSSSASRPAILVPSTSSQPSHQPKDPSSSAFTPPDLAPSTFSQPLYHRKDLSSSSCTPPHPIDTSSTPAPQQSPILVASSHPTECAPDSPSAPIASLTDDEPSTEEPPFVSGWDSDLTDISDLSDLESEIESSSPSNFESQARPSFKIRIPARAIVPANSDVKRICSIQKCRRVLDAGYRWKCCVPCRMRHREYQRRRLGIQGWKGAEVDGESVAKQYSKPAPESSSGSEPEDIPLVSADFLFVLSHYVDCGNQALLTNRRPAPSRSLKSCQDCALSVNPESQDNTCSKCQGRKARSEGRPLLSPKIMIQRPPPPKKTIPPFPKFISRSCLLHIFHERITGFLEANRCYQSIKPPNPGCKVMFKFDGEHSVVALDFEVLKKKDEMLHQTMKLKDEIGRIGGLMFLSTYWVTIMQQEQGISTRFDCRVKALKELKGELEISVFPDYTHVLFPGQRTIVRFCLVG
ncbi:hypothetical protein H0H92_009178 [Tricholoma furcatifolium]|nr:hypothetical protein H0H92_009178 [Tricholoma furcatifolium]